MASWVTASPPSWSRPPPDPPPSCKVSPVRFVFISPIEPPEPPEPPDPPDASFTRVLALLFVASVSPIPSLQTFAVKLDPDLSFQLSSPSYALAPPLSRISPPVLCEQASPAPLPSLFSPPLVISSPLAWCESFRPDSSIVFPAHDLPSAWLFSVFWQVSNPLLRWIFVPNTMFPSYWPVSLECFINAGCRSVLLVVMIIAIPVMSCGALVVPVIGIVIAFMRSFTAVCRLCSIFFMKLVPLDIYCPFPNISLILSGLDVQDSPVLQGFSSRFLVFPVFVAGFFSAFVADIFSVISTEPNAHACVSDAVDQNVHEILVFFVSSCLLLIKCIYLYPMYLATCLAKLWALIAFYLVISSLLMEIEFY